MATSKVPAALIPKIWAKSCWVEAQRQSYFTKFIGENENSIIQRASDLSKNKGDTVTFGLLMKLSGAGVTGDNILEGNEEAMTFYNMSVTIDQLRNAVRIDGLLAEQKSPYNMRTQAKNLLGIWLAETQDKRFFSVLTASPTANHVMYAGTATAENLLTATDKLTCALISKAKRKAMLMSPMMRPVNVQGTPHYVLVAHPNQIRDLKSDPVWIEAQQYANVRGNDNPLFTGAVGMWDGVVVHEHPNVQVTTTGASNAKVGHALFLGAQAAVHAVAKDMYWKEKAFDYDNSTGFAIGIIDGIAKSVYNSEDFGVIQIMTGCADD